MKKNIRDNIFLGTLKLFLVIDSRIGNLRSIKRVIGLLLL